MMGKPTEISVNNKLENGLRMRSLGGCVWQAQLVKGTWPWLSVSYCSAGSYAFLTPRVSGFNAQIHYTK